MEERVLLEFYDVRDARTIDDEHAFALRWRAKHVTRLYDAPVLRQFQAAGAM